MASRFLFLLISGFFVTMNVLLWLWEVKGGNQGGSPVPVEMVWEKMVTAPDNSSLEIRHRGRKIGYCRWAPNVGEELATGKVMRETPPEGMVREVAGYTIDLDGSVTVGEPTRVRFNFNMELGTNHVWERFQLRLNFRPVIYGVVADAAAQTIRVQIEEGEARQEQLYRFSDFRDPGKWLRRLGGPIFGEILPPEMWSAPGGVGAALGSGLVYEARNDWMAWGHSRLRVYRIRVRFMDRFEGVIWVSHVGEILRVELPGEVVMMNDALMQL